MGFFKGNGVNCLKVAPTKGIQFVTFESLKRILVRWRQWSGRSAEIDPVDRLVAGGMAGVVAAAFAYPLETLKSVLTVERGQYGHSIIISFVTLCREQGVLALYRGLVPTLIAMMPYVGVEVRLSFVSLGLFRVFAVLCLREHQAATAQTSPCDNDAIHSSDHAGRRRCRSGCANLLSPARRRSKTPAAAGSRRTTLTVL